MNLPAAQVLLAMAGTPDARGKMVQQGGFKAMLTLTVCEQPRRPHALRRVAWRRLGSRSTLHFTRGVPAQDRRRWSCSS